MPTVRGKRGNSLSGPRPRWMRCWAKPRDCSAAIMTSLALVTGSMATISCISLCRSTRPQKCLASRWMRWPQALSRPRPSCLQPVKPFRDEKILTSWNGLMLSGMVQAYNVLGDAAALQAVRDTITFLQGHMLRDGRLLSVYKDGQAKLNGYLDDYAFLSAALLDAFEATFTPAYFDLAQQLIHT